MEVQCQVFLSSSFRIIVKLNLNQILLIKNYSLKAQINQAKVKNNQRGEPVEIQFQEEKNDYDKKKLLFEIIIINRSSIIRNQSNKYLNNMPLKTYSFLPYLLLFVQTIAQSRVCLYSDSTYSQFINLQHQFKQQSQQSCIACLPICKSCNSVTDQTCVSGNCQSGYYFDTLSNKCKKCKSMCEECTSQSVCAKCIDGYYFDYNNNCKSCPTGVSTCTSSSILECIDGYYYDTQAYLCRKCSDSNCIACSSKLQCNLCQVGYILNNTSTGCLSCGVNSCKQCTSVGVCQKCMVGYQLSSNNFCAKYDCSSIFKCKECSILNNNITCTLCQPGFFLLQNSCHFGSSMMCEYSLTPQLMATQGYSYLGSTNQSAFNLLTDYGSCATCNQSISKNADNTETFCVPKIQNFMNSQFYVFNNQKICTVPYILSSSPSQYFLFTQKMTAAYQMHIQIYVVVLGSNVPVSAVLNQTLLNVDININNTIVYELIEPYDLFCLNPTPPNSMIAKYTANFKILTDYENNSTSQVQSLLLNLSLNQEVFGNSSLTRLSIKQLYLKLSLCAVQNCLQCLSQSSCTKCSLPYLVQNFQCVTNCDIGYYLNNITRKCLSECQFGYFPNIDLDYVCTLCPVQCQACHSISICTKCAQGFYLTIQGKCSTNCSIFSQLTSYYPNKESGQCKKCQNPCKTCSLVAKNCTTCMIGFQIFNNSMGSCVFECPIGYFSTVLIQSNGQTNAICSNCSSTCQGCQMSMSSCTTCFAGFYLHKNQCLQKCPEGYFGQQTTCKQCIAPCSTCEGLQTNCTACRNNLYLLKNTSLYGQCMSICPAQLYLTNNISLLCQKCSDPNCLQCTLTTESTEICKVCVGNYNLYNNSCSLTCGNGWPISGICQECPYPCSVCSGVSLLNYTCSKCMDVYYLEDNVSCVASCRIGEYGDWQTSTCLKCPASCYQCFVATNSSKIQCLSCNLNYILYNSSCIDVTNGCPASNYLKISNNKEICLLCSTECLDCIQIENKCIRCRLGKYLIPSSFECVSNCPHGYLNDYFNALCVGCVGLCGDCAILPSNCTSCTSSSYKFYNSTTKSSVCLIFSECQAIIGYYANNYNNQCRKCTSPCLDCTTQELCTKCDASRFLFRNTCVSECSNGYFGYSNQCRACSNQCQTCVEDIKCLTCKKNYFYDSQTQLCLTTCKLNSFNNVMSMECQRCNYPCETCLNIEYCLTCQTTNSSNLVLFKGQCLLVCPDGFYLGQKLIKECLACHISCQTCISATDCMSCNFGYYLYDKKCLLSTQCPQKYFADLNARVCALCQLPCVTCAARFQCLSCIAGHYLKQSSCYQSCPLGTYNSINGSCLNCGQGCIRCNENQCIQCSDGIYSYENIINNKTLCLSDCPPGTFIYLPESKCEACADMCLTCSERFSNCTSCQVSRLLQNFRCVFKCSSFYYQVDTNLSQHSRVCSKCNSSCFSCFNFEVCNACDSSYLVITTQLTSIKGASHNKSYCSQNCPMATSLDSQLFICSPCHPGCVKCLSGTSCLQCSSQQGYILYNIYCLLAPCPFQLYTIVEQNRCVQEQFCLLNSDIYHIYYKQRKCMRKCPQNLLKTDNNECVDYCNEGQLVTFDRTCIKNEDNLPINQFSLHPFIKNGIIHIIVSSGTQVSQQWISLFNSYSVNVGIDWKIFNSQRRLQQTDSFELMQSNEQPFSNALLLKIVPIYPILEPNDLTISIQMSQPYSKLINIGGYPLQNWQSSTSVQSYMIRQEEIGQWASTNEGIRALPILLIIIGVFISCVNYLKSGKLYLLLPIWDFMGLLYLLSYLNLHLPIEMNLILDSFRVVWLRLFSIPIDNVIFSPAKVHANATDMHLLRNIVCNLVIIGVFAIIYLILIGISKVRQKQRTKQNNQVNKNKSQSIKSQLNVYYFSNQFQKFIFITFYLSIPNLLYFSLINLIYSNANSSSLAPNNFIYLQIPILILICAVFIYCFLKQVRENTFLDQGINMQKKKIIICLPIYLFARKLFLIIFMAIFYNTPQFPLCFGLISTAFIFVMICWFEPYNNRIRYILTLIQQTLLFMFYLFFFIYACNQKLIMSTGYYKFITFLAVFTVLATFIYPSYHLYRLINIKGSLLKIRKYLSNQSAELQQVNEQHDEGVCIEQAIQKNKNAIKNNEIPGSEQNQDQSTQFINQKRKKEEQNVLKLNKKKLKIPKDILIQDQTDHEADQSSQQGERNKIKLADYTVRLIKRGAPVVKEFKNYDISQKSESNDEDLAQKQIKLSKLIQKQNSNKNRIMNSSRINEKQLK